MIIERRNLLRTALFSGIPCAAMAAANSTGKGMLIRKVEAIPAKIPYRDTFVIGRGLVATSGGFGNYVYVRVESADGQTGWGETIALPSWSYETVESITSTVEKYLAPIVTGRSDPCREPGLPLRQERRHDGHTRSRRADRGPAATPLLRWKSAR